jgi:hypothetical protein
VTSMFKFKALEPILAHGLWRVVLDAGPNKSGAARR